MIRIRFLYFFFCLLFLNSCNYADRTDYFFPVDYKNWAIVIYNCKNADKCPEQNGRVQIKIPMNGIFFTSNKRPEGILNNRYFILDKNGIVHKILPSKDSIAKNDTTSFYVSVESYQSLNFNSNEYAHTNSRNSKDQYINLDEIVIFKISKGYSTTPITTSDSDKYLDLVISKILKKDIKCN